MRLRMTAALAALAIAAGAAPAAAQLSSARVAPPGPNPDWVEVNANEQARGYVDRNSVRRENGIVRFTGRINYLAANEHGIVEVFHIGEIDCARRQFRIVGFDSFGEGGRPVISHTNSLQDFAWETIGAGSPNEALHRDHC